MRRWQFTTRQMLLFLAITAVCAFIGSMVYHRVLKAKQFGVASCLRSSVELIAGTDMTDGEMPQSAHRDEGGVAQSSWRFRILRHTGLDYDDMPIPEWEKPWNTKQNLRFSDEARPLYCFTDEQTPAPHRYDTNVMAIVGPDTAFDPNRKNHFSDLPKQLILLCEVCDSATHWMQPGDLSLEALGNTDAGTGPRLGGTFPGGFYVAFADGQVWLLSDRVPRAALMKLATITGAAQADRTEVLGPYCIEKYDLD